MSIRSHQLAAELQEHREKSISLFREAEKLHNQALRIPYAKRSEAMSKAIAKEHEALDEIHRTADTERQLNDENEAEQNQRPEYRESGGQSWWGRLF